MNIFQKIVVGFKAKGFVETAIKEAQMPRSTGKPGWKTTEFWMNLAAQAGVLWGAVAGFVPPKYAAIITVAGTALYTIARTVSKAVTDVQAIKAQTAPVATVAVPAPADAPVTSSSTASPASPETPPAPPPPSA